MIKKIVHGYFRIINFLLFPVFIFVIILQSSVDGTISFLDSILQGWETLKEFYREEFNKNDKSPSKDDVEDFWNAS